MMPKYKVLFVAAVSLAVMGGGMVLGHADEEEEHSPQVTDGKPRIPPSISSLMTPSKDVGVQEVVRASRFELTDTAGNTRAILGLSTEDEPSFALADRSGKIYARLSIDPVPGDAEGTPVLQLLDKAGTARTDLRLTRDGVPVVTLKNEKGGHVASLSGNALHRGGTEWLLSDDNGNVRVMLAINHAGTNLIFLDEGKKIRTRLSLAPDGTPNLVFSDDAGRQKTVAGFDAPAAGTAASGAGAKPR